MAVSRSTAVGGFVLGALLICVIAVLLFGGTRLFTPRLRVVVYFQDSIAGLAVGAPVTLRGVKVGSVRQMKVNVKLPDLVPVIPVFLEIEPGQVSWGNGAVGAGVPDMQKAIEAGLRAQLVTQSFITGQLAVELDFHPDTPINLVGSPDGVPEIPSIPSDLQLIKNQVANINIADLTDQASKALIGIERTVNALNAKVTPVSDSLLETLATARTLLESTNTAVQQLQADAHGTLGHVDQLVGTGREQILVVSKRLDGVLIQAGRATAEVEKVAASLRDMTAPHSPMRGDIEATIRDLAATASSLRSFSRDLERNPSGTLLGR